MRLNAIGTSASPFWPIALASRISHRVSIAGHVSRQQSSRPTPIDVGDFDLEGRRGALGDGRRYVSPGWLINVESDCSPTDRYLSRRLLIAPPHPPPDSACGGASIRGEAGCAATLRQRGTTAPKSRRGDMPTARMSRKPERNVKGARRCPPTSCPSLRFFTSARTNYRRFRIWRRLSCPRAPPYRGVANLPTAGALYEIREQ